MKQRLFVYGLLLFPAAVTALTGHRFHSRKAILQGFRRHCLGIAGYRHIAAIAEDGNAIVQGRVLYGIDRRSLKILDVFEGVDQGLYCREPVSVTSNTGRRITAQAYLAGHAVRDTLAEDWNPKAFETKYLDHYLTELIPRFRRDIRRLI